MLFRRNHRRYLVKIAPELFKRSANLIFVQRGNRSLLDDFSLPILCIGRHAQHECSGVFLVFAHE